MVTGHSIDIQILPMLADAGRLLKDRQPGTHISGSSSTTGGQGSLGTPEALRLSPEGEHDPESCPQAGGALDLDAAPMVGHDPVADAQPEAGPLPDRLGRE